LVLEDSSLIGRVVYSKAGRDKGRFFIIVEHTDENYVYICDGDTRKIENTKKKKIKHLAFTNLTADNIKESLLVNGNISNSTIRKFLQSHDMNKEV
jgi:ribosomal protein L14E/L6E/L27E